MKSACPDSILVTSGERILREEDRSVPDSLRPFFWDVDFDRLGIQDDSFFIISRLLEHGDDRSARFLLHTYGEGEIIHVLKTGRLLSRRSRGFWMVYFGIEGEACSPKQYPTPCYS